MLPRSESIELLQKHRPDLSADDPALNALAAELGDLPLALTMAGSYLAAYRYEITPGQYLRRLSQKGLLEHVSLQGKGSSYSPTGHELHVARTFALSYEKLDPENPTDALAQALLARAACFAPGEPIPRSLLQATLPAEDQESQEDTFPIADALQRLASLGLLESDAQGGVRLHRLLAAFVRRLPGAETAQKDVEENLQWFGESLE